MVGETFEEKEIKKDIQDCCRGNSPDPDGYYLAVYQEVLGIFKRDLLDVLKNLHFWCCELKVTNSTFIYLISKKNMPVRLSEFRQKECAWEVG